jgi:uncharacterized protein (DUF433 family)
MYTPSTPSPAGTTPWTGVYSYREVARILRVSSRRVARWADGYTYVTRTGPRAAAPVLQSTRQRGLLTFDELMELFFVREYVALGVQLPHIRRTAEVLAQEFGPYPFTHARLIRSGRELLLRTAQDVLLRPDVGQIVADFAADLTGIIRFRDDHAARLYFPELGNVIYVDRDVRFGEPVATEHAVPTRAIHALWRKEQRIEPLEHYFGIAANQVTAAIRFETECRLVA